MDYEQQIAQALRRQQDAQGRSQYQNPQGKMVGQIYVAPNPLEYLANAIRASGASLESQMAGKQAQELGQKKQAAVTEALRNFGQASQGQAPAQLAPEEQQAYAQMGDASPAIGGVKPDMNAAYGYLMQAPDAALRQAGMQGIVQMPQLEAQKAEREEARQFRKEEAEASRAQRLIELRLQHENRMEQLRQNNADRAENRKFSSVVAGAVGGQKAPAGYRFKEDGTLEAIPGGPAASRDGQKPLTEGQAKGTLFLGQMRSATEELDKLPQVSPVAVAATGSTYTNWLAPKDAQKTAQLQNQWAEAYLRAKTGAAATQGEVDLNRRTFFPVVGDSPAVIAQKKMMREQAEKDMEATAGPGAATAGTRPTGASSSGLSAQDQQALNWANANPNDPRAAQIRQRLGR